MKISNYNHYTSDFVGDYTQEELKSVIFSLQKDYKLLYNKHVNLQRENNKISEEIKRYIEQVRTNQEIIELLRIKLKQERNKPSWILRILKKLKRK